MRSIFAIRLQLVGQQLTQLRSELIGNNYIFTAGAIRAAEEGVLIVFKMLNDLNIPDGEL